jgi:Ca2+-binding EF-hand superfamily protein
MMRARWVLIVVGVVVAAGCSRQAAPPAKKTPPAAVSKSTKADAATPPSQEVTASDTPIAGQTPVTEKQSATQPQATTTSEEQPKVNTPPPRPERVAILTPGGPLIIDVHLTIAGQPYNQAFQELVAAVLKAGDPDGDGRSTWKALVANREYIEKQIQNAPKPDSRQAKTFIERYDDNRDGRIQGDEAASWIGRDGGTSAAAFHLRSARSFRPVPRATSQVWQLMDVDRDGRLTANEASSAPGKLLAFDADDDRILTLAELASLREQLQAASGQRTAVAREATYYAAIHLEPDADIDRVHYLMSELYSPQQDLQASSFRELGELFKQLDESGDGWLDNIELASLISIEPHVVLAVAYEPVTDGKVAKAAVKVDKHVEEVGVVAQPSDDRVVLTLGNTRLVVSAHNLTSPQMAPNGQYNNQAALASQVRLMVHDQFDAVFEELDANADGRLGEREIERCAESMLRSDADGDGQLSNDELPYSMIVAFLLGEAANQESFYVPPSSAIAMVKSDVEPPTWFLRADLNGDGDISKREFVGSFEQFARIDDNRDGYVDVAEASAFTAK